jgi:hypothetical protein
MILIADLTADLLLIVVLVLIAEDDEVEVVEDEVIGKKSIT